MRWSGASKRDRYVNLGRRNINVPLINFNFAADHTRVDVAYGLLTNGELSVCLLQLPKAVEEALTDSTRPVAVNALRDLLNGGPNHPVPALQQLMPGGGPVLVVAPEYALASGDWQVVDTIVRESNRKVVLLTGFGATAGQAILDWSAADVAEGTQRHLAWRQDQNPISGAMRVNGGWCWIHEPGDATHCIVYIKNVLQQAFEAVNIPDLQTGVTILHLRFNDLDVTPVVCADLIQPAAQNTASPQARIRQMLNALPNDRPALVVGSLLQLDFNQNWAIAIDSLLNVVLAGRSGAVALCNVAHDAPVANEDHDKWRNLSGVFAPYGAMTQGQASLPAVRPLNAHGVAGAVVRQTLPIATAGLVAWPPYNPINGMFVWRGNMVCEIRNDGLLAPITTAPTIAACEIVRFLRRHAASNGTAPRLQTGIQELSGHLKGPDQPSPAALLQMTLRGTDTRKFAEPDQLNDPEIVSALKSGLHALATLKSIPEIGWQPSRGEMGQLRIVAQDRNVLVWRSPNDTPRTMRRQLAAWQLSVGDHPYLVVFGSTPTGDVSDGAIEEDRRDDISLAPGLSADPSVGGSLANRAGDITLAKVPRNVACLGLAHIASVYTDYDAAEDAQRVAELLRRIDTVVQESEH
jgi:hypothetical protein